MAHNTLPTIIESVLFANFYMNAAAIFGFLLWIKPYGSSCSIY
ncbi:hypothetical protein P20439_3373 [Pseudoalteromonas sp. BSi20439]|nr:hypothetical protein P20439_3373 [Pseudoalteromonas sp. BSi20439]